MSLQDQDFLTRVGPGTPMGNLLREFWFPCLPSADLPERGERPLRLKFFNERLIMFRGANGEVSLMSETCPHRGAPLFYGRFEEDGVRCVYHGWKFGMDGRCLEIPNEANGDTMRKRIKIASYPCRDVNGIVWTYMGPREVPPPFPNYGLAAIPADQKLVRMSVRECNWLQALEGDLDLSHGGYLHSSTDKQFLSQNHLDRFTKELPYLEAVNTDFGTTHVVRRSYGPDSWHWGVGHYLFPFITNVPPVGDKMNIVLGHVWIPIDDYNTFSMFYMWNPEGKFPPNALSAMVDMRLYEPEWENYLPPTPEPMGRWRLRANPENNFGFNEEAQRTKRFSGLPTVDLQDHALQVGMGAIVDRDLEHLGSTDIPIVRVRRRLAEAAQKLQKDGIVPECVDNPDAFSVRPATGILPRGTPWAEGTSEWTSDADPLRPVIGKGHVPMEEVAKLVVT